MRDIRDCSSPFLARSSTKSVAVISPTIPPDTRGGELTKTPVILKRPVKPHNTRVSRTESDEGILLRQCCGQFAIASEMALIEDLDRVLLLGSSVLSEHHLLLRSGAYERPRTRIEHSRTHR